jgi:hypothetical protein
MAKGLTQSREVIWRRIGDDIVVIKEDGMSTHVLNKTAAFIWEMCDGESDIDDITSRICERYDVPAGEARADVDEILKTLTESNILECD